MRKKLLKHVLALLVFTFCANMYGQQKTVTGIITDSSGLPLPGASVLVKETNVGAQSDFDGNYSIKAKKGDVLVFSYIGYKSQEVIVAIEKRINVSLSEEANKLDEIVITGYGSQTRATLTTSVSKLDTEV